MATTTHQADELPAQFHLCDDRLDRDFDDLNAFELGEESENLRSHAECPPPDFYGLPSTDCVVYRALAPHNVRGGEPPLDAIVVRSTSLSELQFEALSIGRRLQDAGALVQFGRPTSRGMGRELTIRFVRARPEVLGFWYRDVSEELPLPAPAPVPAEARAVQTTERPGAWTRVLDARATRREALRRLEGEERGAA